MTKSLYTVIKINAYSFNQVLKLFKNCTVKHVKYCNDYSIELVLKDYIF